MAVAALAMPLFCTTDFRTASTLSGPFCVPNILANRTSFHTPSGTFTIVVERNVIIPVAGAFSSVPIVSVPLATA